MEGEEEQESKRRKSREREKGERKRRGKHEQSKQVTVLYKGMVGGVMVGGHKANLTGIFSEF